MGPGGHRSAVKMPNTKSQTPNNRESKIQNPMFQRIIYEDWQLVFPVVALAVASLVYLAAGWRASRMKPAESARLAHLPFENE